MEGAAEFKGVIKDLDAADERLRQTLKQLRATVVETSLRPDGDGERSLMDFVDETGVDGLMATIKESIDAAGGVLSDFEQSNEAFDGDLDGVKDLLESRSIQTPGPKVGNDRRKSPIPDILRNMEDHAEEMADNLESLVKHFDFCVTAIKQTEGGDDAAQQIAGDLPKGVEVGQNDSDARSKFLSEDESKEMMEVLEKDANQVEDVVMDIRDRMIEMEAQHELVVSYKEECGQKAEGTTAAFRLLEHIGSRLPGYITQSHLFLMRWDEEKSKIEERLEELEGLREFYLGFLRAYDNLLIEIGRRKIVKGKIEKVAQDAMTKIERLSEDDAAERDSFRKEQGDFLPADIWPGLTDDPMQYQISVVDGGAGKMPDVSDIAIQQAINRMSGKN